MKVRILDKSGNVWKPYNFSDTYFYCIKLDKIEHIRDISIKKWI